MPRPQPQPLISRVTGGYAYAPTPEHIERAEQICRVPAGSVPEMDALMRAAASAAQQFLNTDIVISDNYTAALRWRREHITAPLVLVDYRLPRQPAQALSGDQTTVTVTAGDEAPQQVSDWWLRDGRLTVWAGSGAFLPAYPDFFGGSLTITINDYRGGLWQQDAIPDDVITALAMIANGLFAARGDAAVPTSGQLPQAAAAILQQHRRF